LVWKGGKHDRTMTRGMNQGEGRETMHKRVVGRKTEQGKKNWSCGPERRPATELPGTQLKTSKRHEEKRRSRREKKAEHGKKMTRKGEKTTVIGREGVGKSINLHEGGGEGGKIEAPYLARGKRACGWSASGKKKSDRSSAHMLKVSLLYALCG